MLSMNGRFSPRSEVDTSVHRAGSYSRLVFGAFLERSVRSIVKNRQDQSPVPGSYEVSSM